ncbi:hypothetical protein SAMN03159448_06626 [Sinorhizobium sp. NFACC03]|nr:hypothetical protein SAMN03159448_06626 [Sinorhizobium sp. NFACC03]
MTRETASKPAEIGLPDWLSVTLDSIFTAKTINLMQAAGPAWRGLIGFTPVPAANAIDLIDVIDAYKGDVTLFNPKPEGHLPANLRRCAGHSFPLRQCADAMNVGGKGGAFLMRRYENISDCGKDRDETLQEADRSKSLHYPLSFSKRHMRILRAIVQAFM